MPSATTADLVSPVRHASRKLVRELGFMRRTLAGTGLSPAAVHCLIEIGDYNIQHVKELRQLLMLDETEFNIILEELLLSGDVQPKTPLNTDEDEQALFLTVKGTATLNTINAYAAEKVQQALDTAPSRAGTIAHAIKLYAEALEICRVQPTVPRTAAPAVSILPGYRPGILGRSLEMHLDYYSKATNFGRAFETELASGFGHLISRLDNPINQIWAAVQTLETGEEKIVGSIIIDGEDLGMSGVAHLRGFIVDGSARGLGVGRKLLQAAMEFVDQQGFDEAVLVTMDTLVAARYLYEAAGFAQTMSVEKMKWGQFVRVLQYTWRRPGVLTDHGVNIEEQPISK